eukprot:TRINITY_DN12026_c0_g1_i1.p1 TRINITY_DN12026_c0_g1~~TRINITY_DN12026_c0_g1_i1.p1  ORF type:complete len:731 (+),score=105.91 TRINITY_DN12026_c0_g1_i1:69-2261(+)
MVGMEILHVTAPLGHKVKAHDFDDAASSTTLFQSVASSTSASGSIGSLPSSVSKSMSADQVLHDAPQPSDDCTGDEGKDIEAVHTRQVQGVESTMIETKAPACSDSSSGQGLREALSCEVLDLPSTATESNRGLFSCGSFSRHAVSCQQMANQSGNSKGSKGSKRESSKGTKSSKSSTMQPEVTCLPLEIPDSLMRGVPLTDALANFGQHWTSIEATAADYDISQSVLRLDDFVSHDWGTPRTIKVIALCFHYNNGAATIASMVVGAFAAVLQSGLLVQLPEVVFTDYVVLMSGWHVQFKLGRLAMIVCPVAYLFFFCFWQRVRCLFTAPRTVFLDKLCIHQTDASLKSAGIAGLAGFLQRSDRLLVLWTPRYFTRLWCAYELAAWSKLGKSFENSMDMLPAKLPLAFLLFGLSSHVVLLSVMIFRLPDGSNISLSLGFLIVTITHVCVVAMMWSLLYEITSVQRLVESFAIQEAQCFCCSNGHRNPADGRKIPCDRRLIYKSLDRWLSNWQEASPMGHQLDYSKTSLDSSPQAVEAMNKQIITELGKCLYGERFSSKIVTYKSCLGSCGLPFVWVLFDLARVPSCYLLNVSVFFLSLYFIFIPNVLGMFPCSIRTIDRLVGRRLPPGLAAVVCVIAFVYITFASVVLPVSASMSFLLQQNFAVTLVWLMLNAAATLYIFGGIGWFPPFLERVKLLSGKLAPHEETPHSQDMSGIVSGSEEETPAAAQWV